MYLELFLLAIAAGTLVQTIRCAQKSFLSKNTLITAAAVAILAIIFLIGSKFNSGIAGVIQNAGLPLYLVSFFLLGAGLLAIVYRTKILGAIFEGRLLLETMLVWFLILSWKFNATSSLYGLIIILAITGFVLWQCFSHKEPSIAAKGFLFLWHLAIILISSAVLLAPYLAFSPDMDLFTLITTGFFAGMLSATIAAGIIQAFILAQRKHESSFAYEMRVKKYFVGKDSEYIEADLSAKLSIVIIILGILFFGIVLATKAIDLSTTIIITFIIGEILQTIVVRRTLENETAQEEIREIA